MRRLHKGILLMFILFVVLSLAFTTFGIYIGPDQVLADGGPFPPPPPYP